LIRPKTRGGNDTANRTQTQGATGWGSSAVRDSYLARNPITVVVRTFFGASRLGDLIEEVGHPVWCTEN